MTVTAGIGPIGLVLLLRWDKQTHDVCRPSMAIGYRLSLCRLRKKGHSELQLQPSCVQTIDCMTLDSLDSRL